MTMVWRLARPECGAELNGEGNTITGARWNSPGRGVVYTSFNLSLCVLETLAHLNLQLRTNLPDMVAVRIDIPDEASGYEIGRSDLPATFGAPEGDAYCREIGDGWLVTQEHLVCTVPSFIVPQERNVMVNPAHRLMRKVKIVSTEHFRFDARLVAPAA